MSGLTSRIILPDQDVTSTTEDIFQASLDLLFSDSLRNVHGDPGSYVIYKSARFGDIKLHLADPEAGEERFLFAHHVWNASLLLAELISGGDPAGPYCRNEALSVKGESVLELGAGV